MGATISYWSYQMKSFVLISATALLVSGCVRNPTTGELDFDAEGAAQALQGGSRGYYTSRSGMTAGNGGAISTFGTGGGGMAGQYSGGNGFVSGGPRVYIQ
jgi:hypothetical protein